MSDEDGVWLSRKAVYIAIGLIVLILLLHVLWHLATVLL
jgi:hypothetical protein